MNLNFSDANTVIEEVEDCNSQSHDLYEGFWSSQWGLNHLFKVIRPIEGAKTSQKVHCWGYLTEIVHKTLWYCHLLGLPGLVQRVVGPQQDHIWAGRALLYLSCQRGLHPMQNSPKTCLPTHMDQSTKPAHKLNANLVLCFFIFSFLDLETLIPRKYFEVLDPWFQTPFHDRSLVSFFFIILGDHYHPHRQLA